MERLLIEAIGPDDDAVVQGFRWLIKFARDHDARRCGVFVPAIGSAENLARPLGEVGSRLARERSIQADELAVCPPARLRGLRADAVVPHHCCDPARRRRGWLRFAR